MRKANLTRATKETSVSVTLALDAGDAGAPATSDALGTSGATAPNDISGIDTGCGFLNHMLTLFTTHSGFGLAVSAKGDTEVDYHHLTEDIGITIGQCFKEALGDGRGIARYGSFFMPMDETLILVALDISGRAYLNFDVDIRAQKVGDFDTELAREFLLALCRTLGLTLHVKLFYGTNAHHILEAVFKGLGRSLRVAAGVDASHADEIPSSKGTLL